MFTKFGKNIFTGKKEKVEEDRKAEFMVAKSNDTYLFNKTNLHQYGGAINYNEIMKERKKNQCNYRKGN